VFFLAAPMLAAVIAYAPPRHHHTKKKHHAAGLYDGARPAKDPGVIQERALRRRTVRLARIVYFERREAQLITFLTKTRTETPLFTDPAVVDTGGGIAIGPTTITIDFLGSAVVRARVRNGSSATATMLLTVTLQAADGRTARASTVLPALRPGQTRPVELTSPQPIAPTSAIWSAQSL
jgi:hypothetical protein